jgi:2-hydroxy-3-oxopropionate reductase
MAASGQKIGFIGLGIMGGPMAANLAKAGHSLFVRTRSKVPAVVADVHPTVLGTNREVAQAADVIILMLPDTPDVELVLFGEDGVAAGLAKGKTVIDMSSISPIATKGFARRIAGLGCDYLDAPVSGGEVGAKNATLSIMVGGSEKAFDRVKQALMGGFASSKILEVHAERMIKRTFDPGFRIELHQKDLNLALASARAIGVSLPNTAMAQELFNSCAAHGGKGWDHSAMVRALETMADFQIGDKPKP